MEKPGIFQKSADNALRMIDVGEKEVTKRRALARGSIRMSAASARVIMEKRLPKGDVLTLAEAAGIMAVKKTPELLPLCHALLIDAVKVRCEPTVIDQHSGIVDVSCEVFCHGKTGVEMEALTGVSAAILCIYDLVKGIDAALTIEQIFLDTKEGGKTGLWRHPTLSTSKADGSAKQSLKNIQQDFSGIKTCVLTVSDSAVKEPSYDKTGPLISDFFKMRKADVLDCAVSSDEAESIRKKIALWVHELKTDVVIVTGGTGIGPRDVTPEALEKLWTKKLEGFGETFRMRGNSKAKHAWLSRACAGTVESTYVVLLPGSIGAVNDGLEILEETLLHTLHMIKGERH